MLSNSELKSELLNVIEQFQAKYELSFVVGENYYEPGMMENLSNYLGKYNVESNEILLRTDVKGLRYENRTLNLERLKIGQPVRIDRDENNLFNSNNFTVKTMEGLSLGSLPAELCDALAPLYDKGFATIQSSIVSYMEKIGERSRYAKQGVLFVEVVVKFRGV